MIIEKINAFVWGAPALVLLLGTGVYLTWKTKFVQFRFLPSAFKALFHQLKGDDSTSQYRSLCTALAATVGTGNIAGVAGAIAIGGPGSVFWMWVSGLIGMATKYAEAALAVRYRQKNEAGETVGGPMYVISRGLGKDFGPLAAIYALFGMIASLGVGNITQINAVIGAVSAASESFGRPVDRGGIIFLGLAMAVMVLKMVSGGASRIGSVAELLVPFASVVYILLCIGVIVFRFDRLSLVLSSIFVGAFTPGAVTGGVVGSVLLTMRLGVSRGVFSNEAGMGTAGMAHAGADVAHPAQQGMMGILEVFIDTILICTMTALVILVSDVPIAYGIDAGSELTARALSSIYGPWVTVLLSLCLCCFAFATVLGWGLYAGRCVEYLFGRINWRIFALFQSVGVFLGTVLDTGLIWSFSELINGLMAIPNLIALLLLSGQVSKITHDYDQRINTKSKFCSGLSGKNVV